SKEALSSSHQQGRQILLARLLLHSIQAISAFSKLHFFPWRMEGAKKQVFTIQVEDGKPGKDGRPAVGPVFRNILAKDGFPPLDPDMRTSWDVFRTAAGKYPDNRMLGWRPFKDGVPGPYLWKSYKEVYEEVLQIGSALQQLGVQPGSRVGIYGSNCPQWVVAMQACNGYSIICVPLYDTLGAGAVDYIIDHAEIDVVFIQDKKIKEILSPNCTSATRLKALVAFTSANNEQIKDAEQIGMKVYSWNDFLKM
uniref:AMP-dependent synthetase/ligase domain-containing protein n=1 Tax=Aegilops tauschii subsp. strangulata TaxID=200361 RepID=A0A452XW33_AEGTS